MNIKILLEDIENRAKRVNEIAGEAYKGSGLKNEYYYGKGHLTGVDSESGANFEQYSYGDIEWHSIPLSWLDMNDIELRDFLVNQIGKEKAELEAKKAVDFLYQKEMAYQARKATYEKLKKEFGE